MTNIEKLYELAGIEKYYLYTVKHLGGIHIAPLEGILENKHLFERNKKSKVKNTYINRVKKVSPPFTDTKQLEIIKWIEQTLDFVDVLQFVYRPEENVWFIYAFVVEEFAGISTTPYTGMHTGFSQALAGLVCELWEDLTDEQREQIKRILE